MRRPQHSTRSHGHTIDASEAQGVNRVQNNTNIGTVDRYVRLAAGLLALGAGASMRRQSIGRMLLMSVGAMKVAEGVTGWCPLIHVAQSAWNQASGEEPSQKTGANHHGASDTRSRENANEATDDSKDGRQSAKGARQSNVHTEQSASSRRVRAVRRSTGSPQQSGHTHDGRTHQSPPLQ